MWGQSIAALGRAGGSIATLAGLVAWAALGGALAPAVLAQPADQLVQSEQQVSFDISPQPLADALTLFGQQAGVQISAHGDVVRGLSSPGAVGRMSAADALGSLLAGTGVTWRWSDTNTVTLTKVEGAAGSVVLDTLRVEGQGESAWGPAGGYVATRSASASKTDTPILETPQAISVVTRDQIVDQGAQSVSESLRYTPGVFVEPNGATSRYDETRIRGFMPVQYVDGLQVPLNQFFATPRIESYGLERVEAVKGPSSSVYGESSPGGLLNLVTKRPPEELLGELQGQVGSYNRLQGAFDVGGPLDEDGAYLYRLTGLVRNAETVVDFTQDDRFYIAPAFTWNPDDDTTLTLLTNYGSDEGTYPQQYLPAQGSVYSSPFGHISEHRFLGEPDFDKFERDHFSLGYAFEHSFDETWTVRQNVKYGEVDTFFQALRSEGLQADQRTLNRSAFSQDVSVDTFTIDNQLQADFATGPLEHKLLGGVDYLYSEGDYDVRGNFDFTQVPTIDVYDPVYGAAIPALGQFFLTHQERDQIGVYVQDQVKLDNWILTGGLRHDWAEAETEDRVGGSTDKQKDSELTGRVGLTYLFDFGFAPYASYATSFQPQAGTDIGGAPFAPTTGEQFEFGLKYQPPGSESLFTLAAFDLTQENALTTDPNDPNFSVQTGEVNVRGVELEARTRLTDNIELIAAYTYLDSEVTKSNNDLEEGRRVPMTPEHQASAWLSYSFFDGWLEGLKVGGGARFVGSTYSETSSADPVRVPSYTLFDAAIHYDLGALDERLAGARFSVNATNLLDRYHVTYCFGQEYCSLGASRTIFATLSYNW